MSAWIDDDTQPQEIRFAHWRKLISYARPYRWRVILLAVTAVTTGVADVGLPVVTGMLIDEVQAAVKAGAAVPIAPYAWAYAGLLLLLSSSIWAFIRLTGYLRCRISHDIRRDGFRNLQQLSFSFYDRRPVGWLMARMTSDCERLSNILSWGFLDLCWSVAVIGLTAAVMFVLDAGVAVVVLLSIPLLAMVSSYFRKRILLAARIQRKTNSKITASFNELIMGDRTSKVFVREQENQVEFQNLTGEMYGASVRNALLSAAYLPLVLVIGSLATAGALIVGGFEVGAGALSVGVLVMFISFARQLFEPIHNLAHWFAEMQMAQANAERVLGLIETEPEIRDSESVRAALAASEVSPPPAGTAADGGKEDIETVRFEKVGFRYGPESPWVLQDLDLTVRAGETIALVGPTGGGKTTIVNLLCRFYEPTCGRVLFDGVDYRDRSLHWLQSKLGIVLQSPHLFSGPIAQNIRYGRLDATDEEVGHAAKLACAHDFISEMENGLQTEVGEGGVRLSTGQKQLISFARAVLAQPQILVMDEATSSVDTETERRIQKGLEQVLLGRTSFVIAHRLSTIRSADRILYIEAGRIVEQGAHAELVKARGRYFELYKEQCLVASVRNWD
ncbi:MAG: ABC transporter ATP-binding protein [Planctomycetota bacterium]